MKTFEIHITGADESINKELDSLGIKNIVVELLHPDKTVLRTEYMSSFISKHETADDCMEMVRTLTQIVMYSKIIRVKIESPVYDEYIEKSLYMESHFIPKSDDATYPLSRNARSGKIMGTDREYDISKYGEFMEKWKGEDLELCLVDSFVEEDADWFALYK